MVKQFLLCSSVDECLRDLIHDDRLAVAVSLKHAMHSAYIPQSMIYCFTDNEVLYNYPIAMYLMPNHVLRPQINQIIKWSLESGLFVKWNRDNEHTIVGHNQRRPRTETGLRLTFEHIFAGLALYTVGMGLAIFAFFFEHVVHPKARQKKPSRLWKWLDMIIDGRRHFLFRINIAPKPKKYGLISKASRKMRIIRCSRS